MTSGERRGIAALATVALLVALSGVFGKNFSGHSSDLHSDTDSTFLYPSDSSITYRDTYNQNRSGRAGNSKSSKRANKSNSSKKSKSRHRSDSRRSSKSDWTPRDMLEDTIN